MSTPAAPHPPTDWRAEAQRAEIHVGLTDETLAGLAVRAEQPAPAADPAGSRPTPEDTDLERLRTIPAAAGNGETR